MDQATLVIDRLAEARKLIECLASDQDAPVSAAYWLESLEDDEWTLHLVSPKFDRAGGTVGYLEVISALRDPPKIQLRADDVRPEPTGDPVVVEVLEFLRAYPVAETFRLKGVFLKGHFVQRAYIFPVKLDDQMAPMA